MGHERFGFTSNICLGATCKEEKNNHVDQKNEIKNCQAWVNVRGGMSLPHTSGTHGWTPNNKALMKTSVKQLKTTKHPLLIFCDANMCPENFRKSFWCKRRHMFIQAPGEVFEPHTIYMPYLHSTCFQSVHWT